MGIVLFIYKTNHESLFNQLADCRKDRIDTLSIFMLKYVVIWVLIFCALFGIYETAVYEFPFGMKIVGCLIIVIQFLPFSYYFIKYRNDPDKFDIYNIDLQAP